MKIILELIFLGSLLVTACQPIDEQTQKQLKKETKKLTKQIVGAIQSADGIHDFISYEPNAHLDVVGMYHKDDQGNILGSLQALKNFIESKGDTLVYACNAGMYMENQEPLGLYIEKGKQMQAINTRKGYGNFYLVPKGLYYVTKNKKNIIQSIETTTDRKQINFSNIEYATQSGPLLVHLGKINTLFKKESTNLNIRNGVGILPNGNAIFAMSTKPINLFQCANYFLEKGCKEVLSFDGFVCRTYCPSQHYEQLDGNFGVMIGVVRKKQS